ncbi:MAG: Glycerol-3-phosphate transporter ATP-binding protein, partial [Pedosphaera sp.]|nr:Glycerol-3-phosphate transporter ATP-binding protein [Pedosphaera sp.]
NEVPPKDRDIAMVFQNFALYPHMTVYENLAFGLTLRKVARADIEERVNLAAELLGLKDCLTRKPVALSGGQKQRVAVGRAMVRQPKVFLFDEPLSNLDAQLRVQMRREIAALHTRLGATMIFVTHDQVEAMTLGSRIAVMKEGVIQQVAAPMELYHRPANLFVAGFIGSPAMNFFHGTLEKDGDETFFSAECEVRSAESGKVARGFKLRVAKDMVPRLADYTGKAVTMGLRPEHITERLTGKESAPGQNLDAVVEVLEPLGTETYLYAAAAGQNFVARVAPGHQLKVKQTVSLSFNMGHAHFFDLETGQAIL